MTRKNILSRIIGLSLLLLTTITGCDDSNNDSKSNSQNNVPNKAKFRLEIIGGIKSIPLGESVSIKIKPADSSLVGESVMVMLDGDSIHSFSVGEIVRIPLKGVRLGLHDILFKMADGYKKTVRIEVVSNIQPKSWSYQIVNSFRHDVSAYTQGLEFHNGVLYEGTGLRNGQSNLRRVDLLSGKSLIQIQLPSQDFGEGITVVDNKVYQLTWQNRIAYCYDSETLKLIDEFRYPQSINEGWGLTHDSEHLIMSDGTNRIHFLDGKTFSEVGHIDVYDNRGAVGQLNELEIIDGILYANIYTSDKIAQIDPKTGTVLGYIDMAGLLKNSDRSQGTDVLNGIAYNHETNKIYVTGKRWPKLFEVIFIPKI